MLLVIGPLGDVACLIVGAEITWIRVASNFCGFTNACTILTLKIGLLQCDRISAC